MSIQAACPHCRQSCPLPEGPVGKPVRCVYCRKSFVLNLAPAVGPPPRRPRPRGRALIYWRVLVGAALVLLLVAVPALLIARLKVFERKVTRENFDQLETGMTEKKARKLLGRPTRIDESAVLKTHGPLAWKYKARREDAPRRFIWEEGEDFIWVDIHKGRVLQFGATIDGEQFGLDEKEHPVEAHLKERIGDGEGE